MYMDRTDFRTKTQGQITVTEEGQSKKKISPTLGFEPLVTQCLVGAILSSPPGGQGMDFLKYDTASPDLSHRFCNNDASLPYSEISVLPSSVG